MVEFLAVAGAHAFQKYNHLKLLDKTEGALFVGREDRSGLVLHASLYEIECGLFYVTYRSGVSAFRLQALPIYQPGNNEREAKRRIEQSAKDLGYGVIIWETADAAMPDGAPDPYSTALRWGGLAPTNVVTRSQKTAVERS